jgi:transaldolase
MVIYADGADVATIRALASDRRIEGFTSNPSLMKKAGITDYREFGRLALDAAGGKPVSFEVLADDFREMERQAREIASWGDNVFVKIPVTNTLGESSVPLVKALKEIPLNITAVMTTQQVDALWDVAMPHHIVSVFAGRILDTGVEPMAFSGGQGFKTLWASAREVFHVKMAEEFGYDIITLTPDLIAKLPLQGKDLQEYSLETVRQFARDAEGITL